METFGARLRAARLAAGLSQRELAQALLSTSQLSLLERDKRRPSAETLEALAERLAVPPSRLCPGLTMVGRQRLECRLDQAERALRQYDFAVAERLATQVICSRTNAARRMRAYCVRAEAREGLRCPRAALDDLGCALGIAKRRDDTSTFARIAIASARLRRQFRLDEAA
jgi:transcriptional regulator with XRE-family HTH domain